jgi:limonene-1,2-epoxide hydrolase
MSDKTCGPHVDLASNDAIKITRCSCGTVHVTLLSSGVTVRMNADILRNATIGLKAAVERLDQAVIIKATGTTSIN